MLDLREGFELIIFLALSIDFKSMSVTMNLQLYSVTPKIG